MDLFLALKELYVLSPRIDVIQLDKGEVCKIPKNLVPNTLQLFKFNKWIDAPVGVDIYPYLHDILFIQQNFDLNIPNPYNFMTYALVRYIK